MSGTEMTIHDPNDGPRPRRGDDDDLGMALLDHGLSQAQVRTNRLDSYREMLGWLAPIAGDDSEAPLLDDPERGAARAALRKVLGAIGRFADADVETLDREQRAQRITERHRTTPPRRTRRRSIRGGDPG